MLFAHIWLPLFVLLSGGLSTYTRYHLVGPSEWKSRDWLTKYKFMTSSVVTATIFSVDYEAFFFAGGVHVVLVTLFSVAAVLYGLMSVYLMYVNLLILLRVKRNKE